MVVVKNGYSEYPFCKGANPESIVGREGQEIRGDQPKAICVEHSKKNIDQPFLKKLVPTSLLLKSLELAAHLVEAGVSPVN